MADYLAAFMVGEQVRIASTAQLDEFKRTWRFHHPLQDIQLQFASTLAFVDDIAFYHGGTTVYGLEGVPGTWHEQCLDDPTLDHSPPACEVYWIKDESNNEGECHLVVQDQSGREFINTPQAFGEYSTLGTMSEVLRKRSAMGFARRFGIECDNSDSPSVEGGG